jgi:hypothetical protein
VDWRNHPKLVGRFKTEHADDLQVIVHDGGPRLTHKTPEVVWVRVTGHEHDVFTGTVLNQPMQLQTVQQGQQIRFIMPQGSEHPVLITSKYLLERPSWKIHPCKECGFSELFDAPSDLMRVVFPQIPPGSVVEMFSSFCPRCGGVQGLEYQANSNQTGHQPPKRLWWQFWKR